MSYQQKSTKSHTAYAKFHYEAWTKVFAKTKNSNFENTISKNESIKKMFLWD